MSVYIGQICRVVEEIQEIESTISFGKIIKYVLKEVEKEGISLDNATEDYILDILVDLEANLGIHGPSYFL